MGKEDIKKRGQCELEVVQKYKKANFYPEPDSSGVGILSAP
jgi:hypothetical protein